MESDIFSIFEEVKRDRKSKPQEFLNHDQKTKKNVRLFSVIYILRMRINNVN